jgi:energy-coupling factor transporter transmembrane protein EcfT
MKAIRQFVMFILVIVAIVGFYIGIQLINDSSGRTLGLMYDDLQGTPFSSYATPGWLYLIFIGVGSIVSLILTAKHIKHYPAIVIIMGIILAIFIIAQITLINSINFLIVVLALFAFALIVLGNFMRRKLKHPHHAPIPQNASHKNKKHHSHKK